MKKYEQWGIEQQEQYEKDLTHIYSHSWEEGLDCTFSDEIAGSWGLYGECTMWRVEDIIQSFREHFYDPEGVFYDWGCGTGKLVSHVALGCSFSKVYGVELDEIRFAKAEKLVNSIEFPFAKPELIKGDFFNQDYSDASVIYFDNTGFIETLENKELVIKLFSTVRPGVLIISKLQIPHILCHRKHIMNQSTYDNNSGMASIFLGIAS